MPGGKVELMKWADAWHEKPTPKAVGKNHVEWMQLTKDI